VRLRTLRRLDVRQIARTRELNAHAGITRNLLPVILRSGDFLRYVMLKVEKRLVFGSATPIG